MEFSGSSEDNEKRTIWMNKRNRERLKKRLKCEDVYARSRSTSPDVYREILNKYRKAEENKEETGDNIGKDIEHRKKDVNNDGKHTQDKTHDNKESEETSNELKSIQTSVDQVDESDSDDEYGPKPLKVKPSLEKRINYGNELLPGEGDAIAQFVQQGKRIPRRGEVGLTSDEIENFEKIGYVMSGSRHRAINAMRIKKESMVLTAEQERAKMLEKYQARMNKENEIVNNLKEMLS
ncbi:predicted protein [Theileria orientalis strain Shintoku]|uniref:NF-kappa-B-activating protein C-terminal domain-containing protein n=1 Tax=Theileria orientalis strain Shintoku TaxID=869250 RepID=J4D742_THEOR|nr:predicted protein [Theileria orientalis strain Shintoku]PVC53058.1 hypothetical protein MACL_00000332 [Theileria orientalis]BAM39950.1 predicted protein [Theileria orientalis strain Shintoku]|eukprot:XP_009690251.1 predicted protein [Theileria orientalis strain Shintoku]